MNMNTKLILLLVTFLFSQISFACRIVSLEKNPTRYIYKMVKETPDIYYAEATSFSKDDESFSFKVLEVIKGEKRKDFAVLGHPLADGAVESDFGAHKAQAFWDDITTARTLFGPDCRLNPLFKIGSRYLIFYKEPFQAKSFELVKTRADRWFKHVYETIHPPKRVKSESAAGASPGEAAPAPASSPAPTN